MVPENLDLQIDWSNFGEEKFNTLKSILSGPNSPENGHVTLHHPELIDTALLQLGAYEVRLTENSRLADNHFPNELHPYTIVMQFHRILNPETQELDWGGDAVDIPLTYKNMAGVKNYAEFQEAFPQKVAMSVAPYLHNPKLLSQTYYQQMFSEISKKKTRLQEAYPDYKIAMPLAQEIFDTWENPQHPLLVLPPGFRDDTMHQLRERMAGDKDENAFYEEFPRACHPNFEGTGRILYLYEQQFSGRNDSLMECFVDPVIPSIQYIASTNYQLDETLKGASDIVMDEVERIQRFRKLRNGRIPESMEPTEAGQVFLSTLYREFQLPRIPDDVQEIEASVIHATEEAFLHNGIQADVEEYIDRYAPIPAGYSREYYAPQIIRQAMENPEVREAVQPKKNEKQK